MLAGRRRVTADPYRRSESCILPEVWTTTDHSLVHKHARAEALVTAAASIGYNRWATRVEVPRGYSAIDPSQEAIPAVVAVEIVRQAGLVVSHLGYGIPTDWAFTIQEVEGTWNAGQEPVFPGHAPLELEVIVDVVEVTERKGRVSGMVMTLDLGGIGVGRAVHKALAPKDYAIMRRNAPEKGSVPPRRDPEFLRDLSFGPDGLQALLGWDEPGNPFVFDHPVDHIPGMLFAQAAFDAHERLAGKAGRGLWMECSRFAELDEDVQITATAGPTGTVVRYSQGGTEFAEARVHA